MAGGGPVPPKLDPHFVAQEGDSPQLRDGNTLRETGAADPGQDDGEQRIGPAVRLAAHADANVPTGGLELEGVKEITQDRLSWVRNRTPRAAATGRPQVIASDLSVAMVG